MFVTLTGEENPLGYKLSVKDLNAEGGNFILNKGSRMCIGFKFSSLTFVFSCCFVRMHNFQ